MYHCTHVLNYYSLIIIIFLAGYNYYATERMYSGINGRELEADIFIGVVYYQRLRHMVSDKFQVNPVFHFLRNASLNAISLP